MFIPMLLLQVEAMVNTGVSPYSRHLSNEFRRVLLGGSTAAAVDGSALTLSGSI